ncbi:MAG: hypothetical protein AABY22_15330 [Nanoarchaeota archaeon]
MENKTLEEFENAKIGEDKPQIEPKEVVIVGYKIDDVKGKDGKEMGSKLNLVVEHPDVKDKKIEISGVEFLNDKKVKQSGLWMKKDNDGKIPFKSALANLLRFVKKNTIKELVGIKINTTTNDNGYLLVKAY